MPVGVLLGGLCFLCVWAKWWVWWLIVRIGLAYMNLVRIVFYNVGMFQFLSRIWSFKLTHQTLLLIWRLERKQSEFAKPDTLLRRGLQHVTLLQSDVDRQRFFVHKKLGSALCRWMSCPASRLTTTLKKKGTKLLKTLLRMTLKFCNTADLTNT